jgi:[CysO sulfur-carrier protein]-S-L-cysteine hydrolase
VVGLSPREIFSVHISRALLDDLLAHVLEDPANEICGVVAVQEDGSPPESARATRVYRAANKHASPMKFEIEPAELLQMHDAIEERAWRIGAIYHSHVRSPPYPSQTDVNFAANWPDVEWIIAGLAGGGEPEVRSYLIERGHIREVELRIQ